MARTNSYADRYKESIFSDDEGAWGRISYHHPYALGVYVRMTQEQYLALAADLSDLTRNEAVPRHIAAGGKAATPILFVEIPSAWRRGDLRESARVVGHEGRNRMSALPADAVDNVLIVPRGGISAGDITPEMMSAMRLGIFKETDERGQRPTIVGDNFTLREQIPEEVKRVFARHTLAVHLAPSDLQVVDGRLYYGGLYAVSNLRGKVLQTARYDHVMAIADRLEAHHASRTENGRTTAVRTDEALWQKIVKDVTAGTKGGKAGQWSARKAQMAVALYKEAGGGYIGPKSADNSLAKWTREKWRTKSGKPSLETGERYLPSAAIEALTDKEYAATTKAKRAGMRKGKQFVPQPLEIATKVAPFRRARKRQGNPMSATFYANPYGGSTGFHFDSAEDFEQKFEKAGFEEYSIEFIDGDDTATLLAKCVPMGGAEIENWYALLDEVEGDEHLLQQIVAYTECNSSLDSVEDFESHRSYIEDGTIQEGDLQDLAHEFVDEGMIDLTEANYFDYDSFARDLGYDGYNHEYLDPDDMKGSDEAKEELESDDYVFMPDFEGDADNADDVVRGLDEGTVCQGMTLEDYAEQLLEETGISSDLAERYADFDKIARDLGYDYSEFDYNGRTYCCRFD